MNTILHATVEHRPKSLVQGQWDEHQSSRTATRNLLTRGSCFPPSNSTALPWRHAYQLVMQMPGWQLMWSGMLQQTCCPCGFE
jgi:hypothetical protein